MEAEGIFRDVFEDYWLRLDRVLQGLSPDEIFWKPNPESNSIGFIVWHLARVEDTWINIFAQGNQDLWVSDLWYENFGMPKEGIGFRVSLEWLQSFPRFSTELLDDYRHAVRNQTRLYFEKLDSDGLSYVPRRTPVPEIPETLSNFATWSVGRMLRQVISEINQHLGQVQYLRGVQRGLDPITSFNRPS